jgi:general secretion pathway protein G
MRQNRKQKGFTIVELLVVVLIISMLAVFVAPKFMKSLSKTKRDLAGSQMKLIEDGISRFILDCSRYPTTLDELLTEPEDMEEGKWVEPYILKRQLIDPWGNPYVYIEQGVINEGSYDLISLGADGTEGGEGENADIYNE